MKLPFFSETLVKKLRDNVGENLNNYGGDTAWLDTFNENGKLFLESRHVVDPPPLLLLPDGNRDFHDGENARLVYTWLRDISPAAAMEERLWACMTHQIFPEYMAKRWPAITEARVEARYLMAGKTFGGLARNGISRLWWGGYLTCTPSRSDHFELTKVLFETQDTQLQLLDRAIGKCEVVRFGLLDFLNKNREWLKEKSFTKRIQRIVKELNLLGGVMMLDALSPERVEDLLNRIALEIAMEGDEPESA